jgi:hypothetical protein
LSDLNFTAIFLLIIMIKFTEVLNSARPDQEDLVVLASKPGWQALPKLCCINSTAGPEIQHAMVALWFETRNLIETTKTLLVPGNDCRHRDSRRSPKIKFVNCALENPTRFGEFN